MRLLLDSGANVDAAAAKAGDSTAFHWSCGKGKLSLVEVLVQYGCDTNLPDGSGRTGLDLAQAQVPSGNHLPCAIEVTSSLVLGLRTRPRRRATRR